MDKVIEAIRKATLAIQQDALTWMPDSAWQRTRGNCDAILCELAALEKRELKPGPNYIETETNA